MTTERINELGDISREADQAIHDGWEPPFTGEIWEWAAAFMDMQDGYSIKGRFDISISRYMLKPFQALRNRRIRQVNIQKAVRTGGSVIADIWVPYLFANDPGDMLWLLQDEDMAKLYMRTRFQPNLDNCPPVRTLLESLESRHDRQNLSIKFPGMSFVAGGLNEGNVQSLGKRYVIVDEGWMARRNGLIRQAIARTDDYPHNAKILVIGQGGWKDDDSDKEFKKGMQYDWGWTCPDCNRLQPYEFNFQREDGSYAGVIWDKNAKQADGSWNLIRVMETAHFECKFCGHGIADTPDNRSRMNASGDYIQTADGLPNVASFHWPSEAAIQLPLANLAAEYLQAKAQKKLGNIIPMIEFTQKKRAQSWDEENGIQEVHVLQSGDYDVSKAWEGEKWRSMQVDCQEALAKFYFNVTAWGAGEVRELDRGSCNTWGELVETQRKWNVKDQHVFVDLGYEQTLVLRECVKHGHEEIIKGKRMWMCWTGLKGMDQQTWPHEVQRRDGGIDYVHRPYAPRKYFDPMIGQKTAGSRRTVPVYYWSNLHIKNTLSAWRDGKSGKMFCLPCPDKHGKDRESFTSQMHAEEKRLIRRPQDGRLVARWECVGKRPNHFWDCWNESFVAAYIKRIIGEEMVQLPETSKEAA